MISKKRIENVVKSLEWNVFIEDFNSREIRIYNIFNHAGFVKDIIKAIIESTDEATYEEKVRRALSYYYWAKSEWEVVMTSWPPYIDREELTRLEEAFEENDGRVRSNVQLTVGKKLDVYNQVQLNWKQFIKYMIEIYYICKVN